MDIIKFIEAEKAKSKRAEESEAIFQKDIDAILNAEEPQPEPQPQEPEVPVEPKPEPPVEPTPGPEPEKPTEPEQPTEENPVVHNIIFGTSVELDWFPHPKASSYIVFKKHVSMTSFVRVAQDIKEETYVDQSTTAGYHCFFKIAAQTEEGVKDIGTIEVKIPETPEIYNPQPFPETIPDNVKVFQVVADIDSEEDQTNIIQEQLNNIPNGTPEQYNLIELIGKDGRIWTEGDLENNFRGWKGAIYLIGRRYLILKGFGDGVTFYSKAPAVPLGSSINKGEHSRRNIFKLRNFTNLWFVDVNTEGPNRIKGSLIGTTPELTPEWWYRKFRNQSDETLLKYQDALIGDREVPESLTEEEYLEFLRRGIKENVPEWYLMENEEKLLGDSIVPEGLTREEYLEYLTNRIPTRTIVPANPDYGAGYHAMVWRGEWEQEHGWDARNGVNLRFTNCKGRYLLGDGIYASHVENLIIDDDCVMQDIGRQNYGFSNGLKGLVMSDAEAINPRRSPIDFEPMKNGLMQDILIHRTRIEGRIAAGGYGRINNFIVKECDLQGSIRWLGDKNHPRKDVTFIDNVKRGSFHSPVTSNSFTGTENVTYNGNKEVIGTNQGRHGILVKDCSGKISICDNDWGNPCIIEVADSGEDITIERNTPEPLIVIRNGDDVKIIGDNPDLLKLVNI